MSNQSLDNLVKINKLKIEPPNQNEYSRTRRPLDDR